jgi:hypothetical protein
MAKKATTKTSVQKKKTIDINGKTYDKLGSIGDINDTMIQFFQDPKTGEQFLAVDSIGGNDPTYYSVVGQDIKRIKKLP